LARVAEAKAEQAALNANEFAADGEAARQRLEGCRQGLYVRVRLEGVAVEFVNHFRPQTPVVLGGVGQQEARLGLIRCRVRRHRWHRGLLKAQDPLVVSCGWRRYQTLPVLCMEDQLEGERHRYLKYSPQHMHCQAVMYGPLVPPGTPLLGFKTLSNRAPGFRVSLTGTVLELNHTFSVVKKLKLTGSPVKVFRNTAFIRGMFNSALEVAKFSGAKIRTVSGLRGEVKKSQPHDEPGTFRAVFEDKILMSDIVSCRLWVPVTPAEFYLPVTSLLTAPELHADPSVKAITDGAVDGEYDDDEDHEIEEEDDDEEEGAESKIGGAGPPTARRQAAQDEEGENGEEKASAGPALMRTVAELRREANVPVPLNKDSLYKPVARVKRQFNPIPVPAKVEAALPYASKSKNLAPKGKSGYLKQRAVVMDPSERKRLAFLNSLGAIRNEKKAARAESDKARRAEKAKARERLEGVFSLSKKAESKKHHRAAGMEQKAKRAKHS
jgi:ribosome biogenesis protein BMS1